MEWSSEDSVLTLHGGVLSGDAPGASQGSSNKPPEEKHQERQYHIVHKQANLARGLFNTALVLTFHICAGL